MGHQQRGNQMGDGVAKRHDHNHPPLIFFSVPSVPPDLFWFSHVVPSVSLIAPLLSPTESPILQLLCEWPWLQRYYQVFPSSVFCAPMTISAECIRVSDAKNKWSIGAWDISEAPDARSPHHNVLMASEREMQGRAHMPERAHP